MTLNSLQLTNMYGDTFLDDFRKVPEYGPESFVVKYSTIIMSISQISETVFILTIPFFLKKFGIKKVMLFSMIAWVLRFGLFAYGNPADGLWMIILSCIVYGMAFDFFNISGSLFVETTTDSSIRSSAQGLFMMMTNGVGATIGTLAAQGVVNKCVPVVSKEKWDFLASLENGVEAVYNQAMEVWQGWQTAWYIFAAYALVVAILFWIFFPKTPVKN